MREGANQDYFSVMESFRLMDEPGCTNAATNLSKPHYMQLKRICYSENTILNFLGLP